MNEDEINEQQNEYSKEDKEELSEEEILEEEHSEQESSKEKIEEDKDGDVSEMKLEEVLQINHNEVNFGNVFPGQIIEETMIILNNLKQTKISFKIKVNCLTKEFDELDEYVYSMRRPTQVEVFNYNDTFLILLSPKAISYYKLAIKVPNCKKSTEILGNIEITSELTKDSKIIIPVRSQVVFPKLVCEKMIKLKRFDMPVIKLFFKNLKRQDFRIALKNISQFHCFGELQVLKNQTLNKIFDISFYPIQINLQANIPNNFMMTVRSTADEEQLMNQEFRFVLLIRIRNSSIIYSFPILMNTGDGSNQFQF